MRTKKLLGIGLGSLLLLSLVGFGTAAAAQHQTEAEPPISLEKEVLCRTGENGLQFSLDGNSWMPQSEYEKEIPKIDWWTASEYEDWIATQKTELEALIGTGDGWYDGQGVFHEWTQDSVNAQIAEYEKILDETNLAHCIPKITTRVSAMHRSPRMAKILSLSMGRILFGATGVLSTLVILPLRRNWTMRLKRLYQMVR